MFTPAAPAAATADARRLRALGLVFVAGVLYASAGLFARALPFDAWTLVAWRCLIGGLFCALLYAAETGRLHWRDYAMTGAQWLVMPVMAAATISYIAALKVTTVANVMIVYATSPFVTALVAWAWNRERPTPRLMAASAVALGGVVVMIGGGGQPSRDLVLGAVLILAMNVGMALLLVLARREPGRSMTPVNVLALLLASAIGFAVSPAPVPGPRALVLMALFGILTVGLAMQLFVLGARDAPSAEVSLVGLSDVVLGPLMVFLVFGEDPGGPAIVGGAVVTAALAWNIWPDLRRRWRVRLP